MNRFTTGSVIASRCRFFLLPLVCVVSVFSSSVSSRIMVGQDTVIVEAPDPSTIAIFTKATTVRTTDILFRAADSLGYFSSRFDTSSKPYRLILGQRAVIRQCTVASKVLDMAAVSKMIRPLQFFDAGKINGVAGAALTRHADAGYPYAVSDMSIIPHSNSDTISVTITIASGPRVVFGPVLLPESTVTRARVLAADCGIQQGRIFSAAAIERAVQSLKRRAYVSSAQPGRPVARTASSDSLPDTASVPFTIVDRSGLGIDGVAGYTSGEHAGLTGRADMSLLNLFHRGEAIELGYRGEEGWQSFSLAAGVPYPFGMPLDISGSFAMEVRDSSYGRLSGELMALMSLRGPLQGGVALQAEELSLLDRAGATTYGADLVIRRIGEREETRAVSRSLLLRTGTAFADRDNRLYPRFRFVFRSGALVPVAGGVSLFGSINVRMLRVGSDDTVLTAEKLRVGGNASLRGYAENQFSFCGVGFAQAEARWYFNRTGHLFIFSDGGAGFVDERDWTTRSATGLFGYGAGLRIPVRKGVLSVAYARNMHDARAPGRIHAGISNEIADAVSKYLR